MNNKFQEKINLLIEQRTIEALKEQLSNKLTTIARVLGKPIIFQSSYPTPYDEDNPMYDGINQMDDWGSHLVGFVFSGLHSGINMEITTELIDSKPISVKVEYNGYIVFQEQDGELTSYAPFSPWFCVKDGKGEGYLNMFYEMATQKEKRIIAQKTKDRKEENEKEMKGFWKNFTKLWGF